MRTAPISIAEVLEIEPNDTSWINAGCHGVVQEIKPSGPTARKKFWRVTLRDHVNANARVYLSMFFAPKFSEGSAIEIVGKGIKRTEYQGEPRVTIGKESEIHVTGRGVEGQQPGNSSGRQDERGAPPADQHQDAPPPARGNPPPFIPHGQTVGMAMNNATRIVMDHFIDSAVPTAARREYFQSAAFLTHVGTIASDLLRVAHRLERGSLAPGISQRSGAKKDPAPPPPPKDPPPPPRANSKPASAENLDEDVPF